MKPISFKGLSAEKVQISTSELENFRGQFRGPWLVPGDADYDVQRKIWNGMIDKKPALIVRCRGAADAVAAIGFAAQYRILISIRGGGHSFPGLSVCDGGLMIDMSLMKGIHIDPSRQVARVEPGVLWGELDRECQAFGLAVTGGQISHTGVAGLTLGGGIGWLMRTQGGTCDHLISADMVLADGRLVKASATQNADLFWAIRGGGGNFGLVTSFEFQLKPLNPIVFSGMIAFPLQAAKEVLRGHQKLAAAAPDALSITAAIMTTPEGHPALGLVPCYIGSVEEAEKCIAPYKKLGPVVMEKLGPMPYPVVQTLLDPVAEPGRRYYLKSNLIDEISAPVIDLVVDSYAHVPSPLASIVFAQLGGAFSRVDPASTAFHHRKAGYMLSIVGCWTDPGQDEVNTKWARTLFSSLQAHVPNAVYVNELGEEGADRIKAAYGGNFKRLLDIKTKYDPGNFFCSNQNIR